MGYLHRKRSNTSLFVSYCHNEVIDGRQHPESFNVSHATDPGKVIEVSISQVKVICNDYDNSEMGGIDEDCVDGEDHEDCEDSEDYTALCKVTMLGLVIRWQPRV